MCVYFAEKPEPPTDLCVVNKTSRSALLSWQPAFDGNSPVTGFTLEYKNDSGETHLINLLCTQADKDA